MKKILIFVSLFSFLLFFVSAQDYSSEADLYLSATPHEVMDPIFWVETVTAGGPIDLSESGIEYQENYYDEPSTDLSGYISEQPALRFDYGEIGMWPSIYLWVDAEVDTVLLVHRSDGWWQYNDDFSDSGLSSENMVYDGVNPVIALDVEDEVTFTIWVGTYDEGEYSDVDLYIGNELPPFVENKLFGP